MAKQHQKHRRKGSKTRYTTIINPDFQWQAVDPQIKQLLILGFGVLLILTTIAAGVQALLVLAAGMGVICYGVFGDAFTRWFNQHEYLLIGASVGLLVTNFNPLGLILGIWLGHFVNNKIQQLYDIGSGIMFTSPILQPISYSQQCISQSFHTINQMLANGYHWCMGTSTDQSNVSDKTKVKPRSKKHRKSNKIQRQVIERAAKVSKELDNDSKYQCSSTANNPPVQPITTGYSAKNKRNTSDEADCAMPQNEHEEASQQNSWSEWLFDVVETISLTSG